MDTFSKSDPVVVLFVQGAGSSEWKEFGRTEVIDNTLNPDFVRKFVLDYYFEEKQNLRFDVYNVDSKSCSIYKQDFLGQAFVALGEVIGSQRGRLERALTGVPGKRCGTILLLAEELSNCRDIVTMQLCANKLDKKDFFGKSDPFLVFYRSNEDGTFTICHKTEVVKNTLNPVWQPFTIPVRALCNGDYDRTVKIDVYDWDRDGSHDFIGEFATSYRELSRAQSQFTVYEVGGVRPGGAFRGCWEPHSGTCPCPQVLNPRKKCKKKKYVNSGTVTLLSFSVESEFTFVDYIRGGTQLNFTVAIDFTASNGMPSQPTSLHYASPYQLSAYALALKAVGEIIQDYDSDKLFPAYGFGAKLPPDGKISHQFPLVRSGARGEPHRGAGLRVKAQLPGRGGSPWVGEAPGLAASCPAAVGGSGGAVPPPRAPVPCPPEQQRGQPQLRRHRGRARVLPAEPAHRAALRAHQLRPRHQPGGRDSRPGDGRLPVPRPPHHHRRRHLRHAADQGGHRHRECAPRPRHRVPGTPNTRGAAPAAPPPPPHRPRRCPCPSSSWEWGRPNSTPWRSWTATRCGCPRGDATPRGTSCSSCRSGTTWTTRATRC
ncbi:copine-9 isoform X3 [Anser cygnoides]|uniref:copine-9 isoform X3 n=1 Tax=Anser cygnoides TaxID=8845 RepID=UPI0034D28D0A